MATVKFWGGKLDGTILNTDDTDKPDWHLFMLVRELVNTEDSVGVLYYYGEHYIIKEFAGEKSALYQAGGELHDLLQKIKNDDFPEDTAYFF